MLSSLYASERPIQILTANHVEIFDEGSNDEEPIGYHKRIRDEGLVSLLGDRAWHRSKNRAGKVLVSGLAAIW